MACIGVGLGLKVGGTLPRGCARMLSKQVDVISFRTSILTPYCQVGYRHIDTVSAENAIFQLVCFRLIFIRLAGRWILYVWKHDVKYDPLIRA